MLEGKEKLFPMFIITDLHFKLFLRVSLSFVNLLCGLVKKHPNLLQAHFCYSVTPGQLRIILGHYSTILYGPRQANLVLKAYASSEGSGEPAHPRSLAITFTALSYKQ